jgi:hypothetical protein
MFAVLNFEQLWKWRNNVWGDVITCRCTGKEQKLLLLELGQTMWPRPAVSTANVQLEVVYLDSTIWFITHSFDPEGPNDCLFHNAPRLNGKVNSNGRWRQKRFIRWTKSTEMGLLHRTNERILSSDVAFCILNRIKCTVASVSLAPLSSSVTKNPSFSSFILLKIYILLYIIKITDTLKSSKNI